MRITPTQPPAAGAAMGAVMKTEEGVNEAANVVGEGGEGAPSIIHTGQDIEGVVVRERKEKEEKERRKKKDNLNEEGRS
jgi:hypothetical protein